MSRPSRLAVVPQSPEDAAAATLMSLVTAEFLALLDWSDQIRVMRFPQDHLHLGWPLCRTMVCTNPGLGPNVLCRSCQVGLEAAGLPVPEFVAMPKAYRQHRAGWCSVIGCGRPWVTASNPLCFAHSHERTKVYELSIEEFLRHPAVRPLPGFGPCGVGACTRHRQAGSHSYCPAHRTRRDRLATASGFDEQRWRLTDSAIPSYGEVSLRSLPDRVVAEVLYGIQERTRSGFKTDYSHVRVVCDAARREQSGSLSTMTRRFAPQLSGLRNGFTSAARRALSSPESERHKDIWDMALFGHAGRLRFTAVSQRWLREATKAWAFTDLPQRRGKGAGSTVRGHVRAMGLLSDSLRLQRSDCGEHTGGLGAVDIAAFCNRLAHLTDTGVISAGQRNTFTRSVRLLLDRMRTMGMARPGGTLAGLSDTFAFTADQIPDWPEDSEAGKDLPADVLRQLCDALPLLEAGSAREVRVAVELLMDTGRRPDEVTDMPLDCLQRDSDGKPVLIYDNHKANRLGRRLPIAEATATLIEGQQARVSQRFPGQHMATLKLLPSPIANLDGSKAISSAWITQRHRSWVESLGDFLVTTGTGAPGLPFDKAKIFPYAYRHSYAQRHADAGVPVDVLRELMNHKQLTTTQRYYRVGESRRREAVDKVTAMQFDRHGDRIWRQAKNLLDSEHARRAIGEVAVPYGTCTEPSNVAAGGNDCPVRFRCVGCGHFRTDVSYLPDLEAYLADLLRNRERLLAVLDADAWARAEATPSDEEIRRVRRLIARVTTDLDDLTPEEKADIETAIAVVRRTRQVVHLGSPRVRQPLPDLRPERTA